MCFLGFRKDCILKLVSKILGSIFSSRPHGSGWLIWLAHYHAMNQLLHNTKHMYLLSTVKCWMVCLFHRNPRVVSKTCKTDSHCSPQSIWLPQTPLKRMWLYLANDFENKSLNWKKGINNRKCGLGKNTCKCTVGKYNPHFFSRRYSTVNMKPPF